jgi:hypothetical protein
MADADAYGAHRCFAECGEPTTSRSDQYGGTDAVVCHTSAVAVDVTSMSSDASGYSENWTGT